MAFRHLGSQPIASIPSTNKTALLLISCQLGFRDVAAWGAGCSNPPFEKNLKTLLDAFRSVAASRPESERPLIIHAQYRPVWTDHPLYVSREGPYGPNGETRRAIDFLEFAAPLRCQHDGGVQPVLAFDEPSPEQMQKQSQAQEQGQLAPQQELIMTMHGHSPLIHTPLKATLNEKGISTLLVAGLSTDQSVSTVVRMAHNLALVGKWGGGGNSEDSATTDLWTDGGRVYARAPGSGSGAEGGAGDGGELDSYTVDMPRIILVSDATRAFGKGGVDAQVVHDVHVESLRDFAEVREVAEVVTALI